MLFLYEGPIPQFLHLAQTPDFALQLQQEFPKRFGYDVSNEEVDSWSKSLHALSLVLKDSCFQNGHILLEFKMPVCSSRCDAIITGNDNTGTANAVVVELKQWQFTRPSTVRDHVSIGKSYRPHPSAQVRQYCEYLRFYHQAFTSGDVQISGCSFLHNMRDEKSIDVLNDPSLFGVLYKEYPVFTIKDEAAFKKHLKAKISSGYGETTAHKIINGGIQPSTKLLNVVAEVIENNFEWRLIDEQLLAFNTVVSNVEASKQTSNQAVILVKGGPGTGKSVLAIQLLAYAARNHWRVAHATGSKAFQTVLDAKTQHLADQFLKDVFGVKYKSQLPITQLFSTFANIAQIGAAKENEFDLVIGDEAHRLWDYRRRKFRGMNKQLSQTPMIEELVKAAKVTVLFLDENQSVRLNEIGSIDYIKTHAEDAGYKVEIIDLTTQFRCLGSKSYLDWVESVMNYKSEHSLSWKEYDGYDFKIMKTMREMSIRLDELQTREFSSRIVAGFCWKWSNPEGHGGLVHDVNDPRFREWSAPWIEKGAQNAKPSEHRYYKWATDESCSSQVGSIYSVQGFEFDYVGLIFGEDLVIRDGKWVSDLNKNKDGVFKRELKDSVESATEKLRNIYRVLLTRGMQGTYVFFLDDETRSYFEEMINVAQPLNLHSSDPR